MGIGGWGVVALLAFINWLTYRNIQLFPSRQSEEEPPLIEQRHRRLAALYTWIGVLSVTAYHLIPFMRQFSHWATIRPISLILITIGIRWITIGIRWITIGKGRFWRLAGRIVVFVLTAWFFGNVQIMGVYQLRDGEFSFGEVFLHTLVISAVIPLTYALWMVIFAVRATPCSLTPNISGSDN